MLKQFFYNTFVGIRNIFKKLFPNFEEIKDVFNDQAMDVAILQEDDPESIEPFNSDVGISETTVTEKKPSLFNRLFKDKQVVNQSDDLYQTAYKPTYQDAGTREFKPYDLGKEPVVNRIVREEKVLDLDYFDYDHNLKKQSKSNNQPAKAEITKPIIISSNQATQNEMAADQVAVSKEKSFDEGELPSTNATTDDLQTLEVEEQPSQRMSSAGHWQNQATSTQDLTTDEIEKVLDSAEIAEPKANKKPAQVKKGKKLTLPGKNLLKKIPPVDQSEEYERINENIEKLERTFESFGVKAKVVQANLGPSVTKYEIEPAVGVKVSKIVSLSDDIALALAARDIRMEAPIPGKSLIGIEVPNTQVSPVSFWEIIDAALESKNLLEVPLGRDISGSVCLADLSKMPHLLIAGATGSGKSVGMNVIIVSLLMKAQPDEVKFLMIDPKKVELTLYDDLPHQLTPVVTNPRKAAQALNKVVQEMERRYELFAASNVRNIDSYNEQVDDWNKEQRENVYEKLPKIIVFVDELADLMMVASNEVENAIIRLAQMARAAGIHMIIATQRPSVDVITGIIKANVPSRLAFAVSSGTDSRTILDSNGAEKLLGRGDMLFQPMGKNKPVRVQGAYISDTEVERITDFIKDQQKADYEDSLIDLDEESESSLGVSEDEYFEEAVAMLEGLETISISQLQRKFRIGYNRAARLVDDMEAAGLVAPQDGSKPRQVL
ncbi:MAG: DNA translocase FtsK [Globicatella sulfidifaciens]|uniref:DNA translocase FtsK n=2 Tax=Globicatella sulfidifaciens TaxID=136093 RepID=A0A7X8C1M8_9LACT|nr:DNA translocase FtsK [Globicatella sulfidifaciens]